MLSELEINVLDGGLGISPPRTKIPQAKVGCCSGGSLGQVYSFMDPAAVRSALGYGPLADAIMHTLQAGAKQVYAAKAETITDGSCGAVTPDPVNVGTGTVAATGDARDAWHVLVEILKDGVLGEAVFRYSLDNGKMHWSKRALVPQAGTVAIPNTAVELTFAVGQGATFKAGDQFRFDTAAPASGSTEIGEAVDVLLGSSYYHDLIHVVGATDADIWEALGTKAGNAMDDHKRWLQIVCETDYRGSAETTQEWTDSLLAESLSTEDVRVCVVSAWGRLACPVDGILKDRNLAAVICGRIGSTQVHVSPGKVLLGSLPMVRALLPLQEAPDEEDDPITLAMISDLDDARFTTVRWHRDLPGFYVNNYRMMAVPGSDFTWGENRRTMDKACKLVRARGILSLHREADELEGIQAELQEEVDSMAGDGEIRYGKVIIPDGQDILGSSLLKTKVRLAPVGTVRNLEVEMAYENPFLQPQTQQ